VVGNLNDQTLAAIWNGAKFAAFRLRVNSTNPPPSCRNCGMARVPNNRKAYAPVRYGLASSPHKRTINFPREVAQVSASGACATGE
jgi:hypothetical protein